MKKNFEHERSSSGSWGISPRYTYPYATVCHTSNQHSNWEPLLYPNYHEQITVKVFFMNLITKFVVQSCFDFVSLLTPKYEWVTQTLNDSVEPSFFRVDVDVVRFTELPFLFAGYQVVSMRNRERIYICDV